MNAQLKQEARKQELLNFYNSSETCTKLLTFTTSSNEVERYKYVARVLKIPKSALKFYLRNKELYVKRLIPDIPATNVIHELKLNTQYFNDVLLHIKNFELRKDDRDFQVGDTLKLREYRNNEYTGRIVERKIKYILRDCEEYGLMNEYCILGF